MDKQKFIKFLGEPMDEKSVSELPGIDIEAGKMLYNLGYDAVKKNHCLGVHFYLKGNEYYKLLD